MASMSENPQQDDRLAKVRWASRVNPRLIRRLYETDARGIIDEELIDEVGIGLYARCESILQANEAHIHGRVLCPECGQTIQRPLDVWRDRSKPVTCDRCGWSVRWGDYLATYQDKHLVSVGAIAMHQAFVRDFRRAATPREKMLAIDALIHAFHWELMDRRWSRENRGPGRSAARDLIWAKNQEDLLTFLDSLTYGEGSTPGLRESKSAWDRKLEISPFHSKPGNGPRRPRQRHEGD